jgi:integrase
MASINRDPRFPRGVYYARFTLADGRRACRSTGKKNRRDAEIVAQAWQATENEIANGSICPDRLTEIFSETRKRLGYEPIDYITVQGWLSDWLASKTEIAATTESAYRYAVEEFLRFLGPGGVNRRLTSITEKDISRFSAKLLKEGRSASTVNKLVRKYLSAPFQKAWKQGKIKFNPVMATDPLKAESQGKEPFNAEQTALLVGAALSFNRDWAGAILFSYGSGARLGDSIRLKWLSLDVANGIAEFRQGKTGAKATIALHPDFLDWLAEGPTAPKTEEYVFPSLARRPIGGSGGLSLEFLKILEKSGIKQRILREGKEGKGRDQKAYSFHSFRHTAASSIFNSAALKEIARRVTAHAPDGSVDRYIHHDLEALKAAVQLIPRLPKNGG